MRPKLERNHCIQLLEAGGVTARELPHAWWNISAKTCKLKFFREKKTRFSGVFGKKLHKSRFIVDFSKCSRQCHQGRQGGALYWTINGMSWKKTEENQIYTWKWQCGKINFQNRKSLGPWERALASLKVVSCLLAPPSYFVCARGGMERQQKQIKMAAGLVPFQSPNKSCFFTLQVQGNSAKDNNHVFITFSTNGRKQTRTWCYVMLFRPLECVFPAKKIEFFIEINWFEPVCLGRYTHTNLLLCLKPAWAWLLPIRAPLFFASPLPPSVVHSISRVFSHFTWLIGTTWRNPITLIRRKITFRKHTVFSSLLANVFKVFRVLFWSSQHRLGATHGSYVALAQQLSSMFWSFSFEAFPSPHVTWPSTRLREWLDERRAGIGCFDDVTIFFRNWSKRRPFTIFLSYGLGKNAS